MIELKPCSATLCAPLIFENARSDPDFPPWATVQHLEKQIADWTFISLHDGSEIIGVMSLNGNRFHLDIQPTRQAKWGYQGVIRRCLDAAFEGREFLETSIDENNRRAIRLAERAGFKEIGRSAGCRHYLLHKDGRDL